MGRSNRSIPCQQAGNRCAMAVSFAAQLLAAVMVVMALCLPSFVCDRLPDAINQTFYPSPSSLASSGDRDPAPPSAVAKAPQ